MASCWKSCRTFGSDEQVPPAVQEITAECLHSGSFPRAGAVPSGCGEEEDAVVRWWRLVLDARVVRVDAEAGVHGSTVRNCWGPRAGGQSSCFRSYFCLEQNNPFPWSDFNHSHIARMLAGRTGLPLQRPLQSQQNNPFPWSDFDDSHTVGILASRRDAGKGKKKKGKCFLPESNWWPFPRHGR